MDAIEEPPHSDEMTWLERKLPHYDSTSECEQVAENLRRTYKEFMDALHAQEQLVNYLLSSQKNLANLVSIIEAIRSLHGAQRKLFLRLLCLYEQYGDWIDHRQIAESAQVSRYNVVRYLTYNPRRKRSSTRGTTKIDFLVDKDYAAEKDEKGVVRRRLYLRPQSIFKTLGKLNYLTRKLIHLAVDFQGEINKIQSKAISISGPPETWIAPWSRILEFEEAKERILNAFHNIEVPKEMIKSVNAFLKSIELNPRAREDYRQVRGQSEWRLPRMLVEVSQRIQDNIRSHLELPNITSSMSIFHQYWRGEGLKVVTGTVTDRRGRVRKRTDRKVGLPWDRKLAEMFAGVARPLVENLDGKIFDAQMSLIAVKARELGPDRREDAIRLYDQFLRQFQNRKDEKSREYIGKVLWMKKLFLDHLSQHDMYVRLRMQLEEKAVEILLECGEDPERYGVLS